MGLPAIPAFLGFTGGLRQPHGDGDRTPALCLGGSRQGLGLRLGRARQWPHSSLLVYCPGYPGLSSCSTQHPETTPRRQLEAARDTQASGHASCPRWCYDALAGPTVLRPWA